MKLSKNLLIIANSLRTRYKILKKLCVHACIDSTSPSLFAYVPILMELKRIIEIRDQTGRVCTTVIATTFRIQGGQVNL